jgi:uncharacterized membrane protein
MTIAGLPLHPFAVHLSVTLVPAAAFAFTLVMWKPAWRLTYGWLIAAAAVLGAAGSFLAVQSGEALEDALKQAAATRVQFGEHPEQGETAQALSLAFAAVVVALWAVDRWADRWSLPAWAPHSTYGLGVVISIATVVTVTIAGDSGARLVWEELGTFVSPR